MASKGRPKTRPVALPRDTPSISSCEGACLGVTWPRDAAEAAHILEPALADLPRIGGSHAQREVFEDSLIVAYLRSGQSAKAAPLLNRRLTRRPAARDKAWLALCANS